MTDIERGALKGKAVRGVVALTTRTFLLQVISLVSFSLLTYYLEPNAIGVLGAAVAATKIFTLFTDIGFGAALIQKKDQLEDRDLQTTFTLQEILVSLVVLTGLFFSKSLALYFNLSVEGLWLFRTLIFLLFISSLKTIPSILMERRIQFEKQIFPQIVESLIFNILVVILALKGLGVASFSWAFLLSGIASLPIYYFLAPWKIGFQLDWKVAKKILTFGTPYQLKSILGIFKDDFIKLYATKTVGLGGIGFLEWGQRWAFSPFRFIVDSVTKVTFPAFARIQEEKAVLKKALETSLFTVSTLMFPLMAGLVIVASYFVVLIPKYQKWESALPILYFFSLNAAVSSLSNLLVNVLDAIGKVKTTLTLMIFWTLATWILTPIGIYYLGAVGVAAVSALITFSIFITVYLVKKTLPFNFFTSIHKPLLASFIMLAIIFFEKSYFGLNWISLVLTITTGAIIYSGLMFALAKKEIREIIISFRHK